MNILVTGAAGFIGYHLSMRLLSDGATVIGVDNMIIIGLGILVLGLSLPLCLSFLDLGTAETFFGFMALVGLGNGICMPNATAGMLAVKPRLAGAASGLGGSMMIGFGAVVSIFAGFILTDDSTDIQLLMMMWILSLCATAIALLTKIRAKPK